MMETGHLLVVTALHTLLRQDGSIFSGCADILILANEKVTQTSINAKQMTPQPLLLVWVSLFSKFLIKKSIWSLLEEANLSLGFGLWMMDPFM